jgi:serine phosphatase RsbU (regulator of sigma subunit)
LPLVLKTPAGQANLPLGVFRSVRYDQGEERVQAGDRILLYTDGLSEAMSPESGEEFGEKEFLALLGARADVELATVRDSLVEAVTAFPGGPILTDDCKLMVVEVR